MRCRLDEGRIDLHDESGLDLSLDPARELGDPVVLRRDGAYAYHLVCVVDDAESGVTRVVRGRDLASATAPQVALQRLLGHDTPVYRHHPLFLEQQGGKLAKLHGAVAVPALRAQYDAPTLCGLLACWSGLRDDEKPCRPRDLMSGFTWARVMDADAVVAWDGQRLRRISARQHP